MSEKEWVEQRLTRWRDGRDTEALGELIKWQRDRAYATARSILGCQADAEDAVQQAAIKLITRTHGFGNADDFRTAMYRAVVQCAIDMSRASRSRKKVEGAMSPQRDSIHFQPAAESAETLNALREELGKLPPEERTLLVLCCQEGMSIRAASEVLDQPRETLRDRLAAALTGLRKTLERRGISLSVLLLIGTLQQGNAMAAPTTLCATLNASLPGASCLGVTAQAASAIAPNAILSASGIGTGISALKIAMVAALLIGSLGAVVMFTVSAKTGAADKSAQVRPASPALQPASVAARPNPAAQPLAVAPIQVVPLPVKEAGRARAAAREIPVQNNPQNMKVELANLPVAVREAAQRAMPGIQLTGAEKDFDKGNLVFEVKGRAGEKLYDIKLSEAGNVLQIALDDDDDQQDEDEKKQAPPKTTVPAPQGDF